jgi:hypothetical protein
LRKRIFDKGEVKRLNDKALNEIKEMQDEYDYRTKIENMAIELISKCKFKEALEILDTI